MSLGGHGTPELSGELPGVNSNLDNVVEQRQQRCQGEGGNKQRDEAELDHWDINEVEVSQEEQQWVLERGRCKYSPISRYS